MCSIQFLSSVQTHPVKGQAQLVGSEPSSDLYPPPPRTDPFGSGLIRHIRTGHDRSLRVQQKDCTFCKLRCLRAILFGALGFCKIIFNGLDFWTCLNTPCPSFMLWCFSCAEPVVFRASPSLRIIFLPFANPILPNPILIEEIAFEHQARDSKLRPSSY